jgi:putative component of toxin-antitoxin plasmid stabilization module
MERRRRVNFHIMWGGSIIHSDQILQFDHVPWRRNYFERKDTVIIKLITGTVRNDLNEKIIIDHLLLFLDEIAFAFQIV